MLKLHKVETESRSVKTACGPYALSALTGIEPAKIEQLVNQHRDAKPNARVWAMRPDECAKVLKRLGYTVSKHVTESGYNYSMQPTLAQWMKGRNRSATYLVLVTNHFILIKGTKLIDTYTRKPVACYKAPHRRKRVKAIYQIQEGK